MVQKNKVKQFNFWSGLSPIGIVVNLFFCAWYVLHNDLSFHTDIGRDFLLFAEIVQTKKLTLIGPRSGGIPGVFHGPLWLYLNLPAFLIGQGNPVTVGWFWVILAALFLLICFFVAQKLFSTQTAWLATFLISSLLPSYVYALFNPFGAVMIAPLVFYFFILYLKKNQIKDLLICLFLLGLTVHFQIAFALPILLLITLLVIYKISQTKKFFHLFSYFILAIPLSTYFVFELRHNFLQSRAIADFIFGPGTEVGRLKFIPFLIDRFQGMFLFGPSLLNHSLWIFSLLILGLFFYAAFKKKNVALYYRLFLYFYFGFWLTTFLFKGVAWNYYYWPFLGITAILFCGLADLINRQIFIFLFACMLLLNSAANVDFLIGSQKTIGLSGGSWKFNQQLAEDIFKDAGKEFGYFVYSPDLFGYPQKYALNYLQTKYPAKKAYPYQKKPVTYLIINPAPDDKPYLKGDWWIENQVKIKQKPLKKIVYTNKLIVAKYALSEQELKVLADPNLIQDLHFR